MKDTAKRIIKIIMSDFPNGIRSDFIDTNKVMRIYLANYADDSISQDLVVNVIRANGIEDRGRFYLIEEKNLEVIFLIIYELLEQYSIVYYSVVHEKHEKFFTGLHIFSPKVLKKILQKTCNDYFYFDEFCSANRMTRLDYEILKIFMLTEKSLSLKDLQAKLPYVPTEKILAILNDEKRYLPTTTGKYVSVSRIKFDSDEINAAIRQISSQIGAKGYATTDDYDLSSNFALNFELAEKNVHDIIYAKFFSTDFTKRGKKLFKKNAGVKEKTSMTPTNDLLKFIAEQDELTVGKLFDSAKSFGNTKTFALYIAYEMMTRVTKNLFVKDSLINFDVAGIDEALTPFVQGKIISLQSVTSFTGFPPVEGYSWNLFLLESFLRKYSYKYSYNAPAVNSSNLGAIYPKSMNFKDYLEVQAAAVVQEKIPLEKSAVEDFLVRQGFRARRISRVTEDIIALAQEISLL